MRFMVQGLSAGTDGLFIRESSARPLPETPCPHRRKPESFELVNMKLYADM